MNRTLTTFSTIVLVLIAVAVLGDAYTQYVVNLVITFAVISIGLNIVLGFSGLLSFAHSAFVGVGAYATAIMMSSLGMPYLFALPAAGLFTAFIGVLVGLPAVRVKGLYLALVTIACLYFFEWTFIHWDPVTNGTDGMVMPDISVFGIPLFDDLQKTYVLFPVAVLMYWVATRLMSSRLGRSFVMVRDAELAAQTCGINIMKARTLAFATSAFYAGVGGGMFAATVSFIDPHSFGLLQMIMLFGMVLIGGISSLVGSLIGAVTLTVLPEFLREFQGAQEVLYGLLMIIFIIYMPNGIAGLLRSKGLIQPTSLGGRKPSVSVPCHKLLGFRFLSTEALYARLRRQK